MSLRRVCPQRRGGNAEPAAASYAVSNSPTAQFGYVYGLDALRFGAIAIVMIRHYNIVKSLPGGFGVSIFFFISGLLISRLLLAEEQARGVINLKNFYIRRMVRLFPPLILMGVVMVPVMWTLYPESRSVLQIVFSFTYLGNIVKFGAPLFGWRPGQEAFDPLWSLAVEEHFYALFPPILLVLRSWRSRLLLIATALSLPLLLRIGIGIVMPAYADQINYHFTFTRLDAMAWGVGATLVLDRYRVLSKIINRYAHFLVIGGTVAMVVTMIHWTRFYEEDVKYTPQSLAICLTCLGLLFSDTYAWARRLMEWRPIRHLGRISYEMYLWHLPIYLTLALYIRSSIWLCLAATGATLVISDLAYRVTTKQLRRVRERFGAHPVS